MSDEQDRKNRVMAAWSPEGRLSRFPYALDRFPAYRRAKIPVERDQKMVSIFRSVPPEFDTIRPGDWVALTREYASQLGRGRILEMRVPAEHVYWAGTDEFEWFYTPPPDVAEDEGAARSLKRKLMR